MFVYFDPLSGKEQVETDESIYRWAVQTFGYMTPEQLVARAHKEMAELHEAIVMQKFPCDIREEVADTIIPLLRIPHALGSTGGREIARKMTILRERKWTPIEKGFHKHV